MPPHYPRSRPPWWPETAEWPPNRRWRRGGPWIWRVLGLLLALFFFVQMACGLVAFVSALIAINASNDRLPFPHWDGPMMPMDWVGWRGGISWLPFVGLPILIVFGIALTVFVLRRTAAPVAEVMEAADRVADGDYEVQVVERGSRETRDLARSFNTMTERLKFNDDQRRRLLADVTHELRTPTSVIQGHLEAMLDGVYPRDDDHLTAILDETQVLSRLIEDLRTLSLAESGALKLQRETTDVGVLIADAVASLQPQATANTVSLTASVPEDLPLLDLDPTRIREVVANLLTNALRYTAPGGSITVTATHPAKRVIVAVRDTGAGIRPEQLAHVFDRFYKSDDSRGSGLGLAIAKSLLQAHDGDITVESVLGQGTTFTFWLPTQGE